MKNIEKTKELKLDESAHHYKFTISSTFLTMCHPGRIISRIIDNIINQFRKAFFRDEICDAKAGLVIVVRVCMRPFKYIFFYKEDTLSMHRNKIRKINSHILYNIKSLEVILKDVNGYRLMSMTVHYVNNGPI